MHRVSLRQRQLWNFCFGNLRRRSIRYCHRLLQPLRTFHQKLSTFHFRDHSYLPNFSREDSTSWMLTHIISSFAQVSTIPMPLYRFQHFCLTPRIFAIQIRKNIRYTIMKEVIECRSFNRMAQVYQCITRLKAQLENIIKLVVGSKNGMQICALAIPLIFIHMY